MVANESGEKRDLRFDLIDADHAKRVSDGRDPADPGSADPQVDVLRQTGPNAMDRLLGLILGQGHEPEDEHGRPGPGNRMEEIFHRDPDRFHARWLAFGLHVGGRLDEMVGHLHRVPPASRETSTVDAAADIADWAGDPQVAAELRSLTVS